MKKLFFSLLETISSLLFHAQDFPKIFLPSPEASSLAKFTEIPVLHYTGVPNISIPIHTINQKGISIPISLNYHSRGVQVSEIASRVGIGWALSNHLEISRITNLIDDFFKIDLLDEYDYYYYDKGYSAYLDVCDISIPSEYSYYTIVKDDFQNTKKNLINN